MIEEDIPDEKIREVIDKTGYTVTGITRKPYEKKRLLLPLKKRLIHQTKLIRRLYSAKIRSCAVFFFWMDKGIFLYYNDVRYYLFKGMRLEDTDEKR